MPSTPPPFHLCDMGWGDGTKNVVQKTANRICLSTGIYMYIIISVYSFKEQKYNDKQKETIQQTLKN